MNKWILLTHQIAQDTPNLRVKVWRDLKKHGAILFKNAVYILPYNPERGEIMQWLCKCIRDHGSDASLFITESLDKNQDAEIVHTFREACDREYLLLADSCGNLLRQIEQAEGTGAITDNIIHDSTKRFHEIVKSTEAVTRVDFFHAQQKEDVLEKTRLLRHKIEGWSRVPKKEIRFMHKVCKVNDFVSKKWITRKNIYIDRIASAWLIRKFIDPKAKFIFISQGKDDKIPGDTIPFDMYGAEFTHHGSDCTFETLIKAFGLKEPALQQIAEIVHDIDLKDDKYSRGESEGLGQIITGLSQKLKNDKKLLEKGFEIFDALYQCHFTKK